MRGLVYKDFRILCGTLLVYVPITLLLSIFAPDNTFTSSFTCVMLVILPTSCFTVEENCGWNKYAATLPVGRSAVVGGRYLLTLILLAGIAAILLLTSLLPHAAESSMSEQFASLIGTLAFIMVDLPLTYRFGRKLWIYIVAAVICIPLIFFALFLADLAGAMAWPIALVLAAVGCFISYKISCSIVAKSEY